MVRGPLSSPAALRPAALRRVLPAVVAALLLAGTGCRGSLHDAARQALPEMVAPAPAPRIGEIVLASDDTLLGDDAYVLNDAVIADDALTVSVSYGGGCRQHALKLVIADSFTGGSPALLPAVLRHEAHGDPCEAWLTVLYVFPLDLVRTRYREAYGRRSGVVVLQVEGGPEEGPMYLIGG